ncbi:hypothetical protein ScPMuIL_012834 [Solemya velum]
MKTKRMLRSKVYYEDGHVFGVQSYCDITLDNEVTADCSHCVIRAKVMPSFPKANEKQNPNHDTWLIMSKETGNVHSANCDCTAGKGESCNHIAAVMYALVDISDKKSEGKLASTSQKQKWNVPRKRKISPKKVQNVKFRKYSSRPNSGTSNVKSTLFRTPDEKVKSHVDENFQCTVDGQLALTCRKWCDFVVWTLKGMSVERIYFEEAFWIEMAVKLKSFYISSVIPELMTNRVRRELPLHKIKTV